MAAALSSLDEGSDSFLSFFNINGTFVKIVGSLTRRRFSRRKVLTQDSGKVLPQSKRTMLDQWLA